MPDEPTDEEFTAAHGEWEHVDAPTFYLAGYIVAKDRVASPFDISFDLDPSEDYDLGLILGEHNDVHQVKIALTSAPTVTVSGVVELSMMGCTVPFLIEWKRAASEPHRGWPYRA